MIVWEKSIELIKEVYRDTEKLPSEEKFGLVSQLRRAAVSVVSNISEGEARKSSKGKRRFYEILCASLIEIDAQVEISMELDFIDEKRYKKAFWFIKRMFYYTF